VADRCRSTLVACAYCELFFAFSSEFPVCSCQHFKRGVMAPTLLPLLHFLVEEARSHGTFE
jgi:hypothetical protein